MQISCPELDFTFEDFEVQAVSRLTPETTQGDYTKPSNAFWINKQGNVFDWHAFSLGIMLNHLHAGESGNITDTFNLFSFDTSSEHWDVICEVFSSLSTRNFSFSIKQKDTNDYRYSFFNSGLVNVNYTTNHGICLFTSYDVARQHYILGFTPYGDYQYNSVIFSSQNYISETIQSNALLSQLYTRNENKIVNTGFGPNAPENIVRYPLVYGDENFSENAGHTTSSNNYNDDTSNTGGGGGTYQQNSDPITDTKLPTNDSLTSGFIKAYNPTDSQLQSLATFLLSDDFLTNVSKLFENPMDYIIALLMLPITPTTSGTSRISCGGVDTKVDANRISKQFIIIDMGSIKIAEKWGGFLDYAPNTSVKIFLPFIGFRDLEVDDVMNATLSLKYKVDVLSGACVASINCNTNKKLNSTVYYFDGNMSLPCSITAVDYNNRYSSILQSIGGVASAGVSAVAGNPLGVATGIISTANAVLGSKPIVQRSGNISGNTGIISQSTPFIMISRPTQSLSTNYKSQIAYPSNISGKISGFKSYTEFESVKLDGIPCTQQELNEIETLLKGGVYL